MALSTPWLQLLEPLAELDRSRTRRERDEENVVVSTLPAVDMEAIRAEAEAILTHARAEAAEMREDAEIQAEALREAAWQEGHHQGKTEARIAVETEMRALWDARQAAMRTEIDTMIAQIATAREALWVQQEPQMVGLSLDIARQVIKTEVTQNPEVVRALIANALRRITDKDNIRVRVSVTDAPHVKEIRQELMEMVDGLRHLEILDDRRIGEGGCVIETNAGTIDAKIETQLSEVARVLGVSENG